MGKEPLLREHANNPFLSTLFIFWVKNVEEEPREKTLVGFGQGLILIFISLLFTYLTLLLLMAFFLRSRRINMLLQTSPPPTKKKS